MDAAHQIPVSEGAAASPVAPALNLPLVQKIHAYRIFPRPASHSQQDITSSVGAARKFKASTIQRKLAHFGLAGLC